MRRRRSKSGIRTTRQSLRAKHTKDCKSGKHDWYPQNSSYANRVYCRYCKTEDFTKNLPKEWRERIASIAKTLRECKAKVRALHPIRTFNKDGY